MNSKLLLISKVYRTDLYEVDAFLTTRAKGPNINGYKKIGRLIKYLRMNAVLGTHIQDYQREIPLRESRIRFPL